MGNPVEVLMIGPVASQAVPGPYAEPTTATERSLAEVLVDLVSAERVSVDSHFFDDLGADSMVMARFCARVRKRADLPSVSMTDIYRNPTIRSLAAAHTDTAPVPAEAAPPARADVVTPVSTLQYAFCGTLQLLVFLGYSYLAAIVIGRSYEWIFLGAGPIEIYLRSVLVGSASFLGLCTLPILVKWVLIGRWEQQQIRVWSLAYVRFWIVKTLVRANPMVLFVGTPLYVLYLRALGARIGRGVVILSRSAPVCTDLLTIGDGTVIGKDSHISCYRAHAGLIQTGPVTLGKDVFVSELTVLDIETSLGDGAQLGHASSLQRGQAVPDGERWHGSPALRADVNYRGVPPAHCGALRRLLYPVWQLLSVLVLYVPLAISGLALLLTQIPQLAALLDAGPPRFTSWTFYRDALVASCVLFFGSLLVGFLVVVTVPRVLNLAITPDKVYRLYGFHFWAHRTIARLTNAKFFMTLFGDSSYVVGYLRCVGYKLPQVEQTGSNFGTNVKHENPYLVSIGSGTMVADGLSLMNAEFSSTSFRVSRTSIGAHNFLGNSIGYPVQGRTGDNCLLGTKAMIPIDGEVREDVGLLGSPSFEIPRTVERDTRFDHLKSGEELRRRLSAKNRHNTVTMALFLLARWFHVFGVTLLGAAAVQLYRVIGAPVILLTNVCVLLFTVVFFVLVERASTGFRDLRPLNCSIYDRSFWRHERFWKGAATSVIQAFNGTPFKNVIWRLLGVRLGKRLFDDGCGMPERTLVTIGDDVTLNAGSTVQCHSQEDGTFKSDRITIGSGCTIGVGAWVHYGVTMGDGTQLAADSFLMKGEEVPAHARWGGNPARDIREAAPVVPAALPPLPRQRTAIPAQASSNGHSVRVINGAPAGWKPSPRPRAAVPVQPSDGHAVPEIDGVPAEWRPSPRPRNAVPVQAPPDGHPDRVINGAPAAWKPSPRPRTAVPVQAPPNGHPVREISGLPPGWKPSPRPRTSVPVQGRRVDRPAREIRHAAPAVPAALTRPTRSRRRARTAGVLVVLTTVAGLAGGSAFLAVPPESPTPPRPLTSAGTDQQPVGQESPVSSPSVPQPAPDAPPAESRAPAASDVTPLSLDDLPQLGAGLGPDSRGTAVGSVQQHLQQLGYYQGPVHGQLDGQTAEAVRRFQADARVVGDPPGNVGVPTAVALLAAGPRPELALGSSGEDVHRLQHALVVALGRPVPVNGKFQKATQEAVRDYQSSRGLSVDGGVAAETWTALQRGR